MRTTTCWILSLGLSLAASGALADGLVVRPVEHASWTDSVADLQRDPNSENRVIHVTVRSDAGQALQCGSYVLRLDPVAARAFTVGECDLATNATAVRLIQRASLFTPGPNGPRATGAVISAVALPAAAPVVTAANSGGSAPAVVATAARVQAAPTSVAGPASSIAAVAPVAPLVTPTDPNALPAMTIGLTTEAPALNRVATRCVDAPRVASGVALQGTTLDGRQQPIYHLRLADRSTFTLNISSNFGGSVNIFRRCPESGTAPIRHSSVFGVGPDQRIVWDLAPGNYYVVIVDADIAPHRGVYSLRTDVEPDYLAFWRR